jgi:hypothetical protein
MYTVEMASCGKYHEDWYRHVQVILRFCLRNLNGCSVTLLKEGIDKFTVEMGSSGTIYIQSFMKIRTGMETILMLRLRNMKGCNVGITNLRDL